MSEASDHSEEEDEKARALRQKIAEVFKDTSLTPQQRFQRVNELRGIQGTPQKIDFDKEEEEQEETEVGECPHYERGCLVQCDKCSLFVNCRLCHDELDRFSVAQVKCKDCLLVQPPSPACTSCAAVFGRYACLKCNLFQNREGVQIFHCDACGICRIGSREEVTHCEKCHMCIPNETWEDHTCFASTFASNCAACLKDLKTSTIPASILRCGHAMHSPCLAELSQNDYRCPICRKQLYDMDWAALEAQMAVIDRSELPEELRNKVIDNIVCYECENRFSASFSPFNMYKCTNDECGSYNTST